MSNINLSKKLGEVSNLLDKRESLVDMYNRLQDPDELNRGVMDGIKEKPNPPEKPLPKELKDETLKHDSSAPESLILAIVIGLVMMIVAILFLSSVISFFTNINNNPGDAWNDWIRNYWTGESATIESISKGWHPVFVSWLMRGRIAPWFLVEDLIKDNGWFGSSQCLYVINRRFKNLHTAYFIIGGIALFFLVRLFFSLVSDYKSTIRYNKECVINAENARKENIEIKRYNKEDYPKVLEKYQQDYEQYEKECKVIDDLIKRKKEFYKKCFKEESNKTNDEIKKIDARIRTYSDVVNENQLRFVNRLRNIIDMGRAESIKEAMNVMYQDDYNEELIREQQRQNDIYENHLWQMRTSQLEHQHEMELQARRESDEVRRHNEEMERQNREAAAYNRKQAEREIENSRRSTEAVVRCSSCPNARWCQHIGRIDSHCSHY